MQQRDVGFSEDVVAARLDGLAKPRGSLGRLERLARRLAVAQRTLQPETHPRRLLLFAGDHGVVRSGVGLWPSGVTAAMIGLIASGRASSTALARATATPVTLIDVGSLNETEPLSFAGEVEYRDERVGRGTQDLSETPAMTSEDFRRAWDVGAKAAAQAAGQGCRVVGVGEMGIGNTTSAACLTALLTGCAPEAATGPGAGATPQTIERKRSVVARATARARERLARDPEAAIASVAGFEIAALAGAISGARAQGMTVVLDGFVAGAGALIAERLQAGSLGTAIAAHRSAEPGHTIALSHLGLEPYLEWDLRLGEGTGALLLMPLLDAAAALLTDVATIAEVTGP